MELGQFIETIESYTGLDRRRFLAELDEIYDAEEQFQKVLTPEWEKIAMKKAPQCMVAASRYYNEKQRIKLSVFDTMSKPVPIIIVEVPQTEEKRF